MRLSPSSLTADNIATWVPESGHFTPIVPPVPPINSIRGRIPTLMPAFELFLALIFPNFDLSKRGLSCPR